MHSRNPGFCRLVQVNASTGIFSLDSAARTISVRARRVPFNWGCTLRFFMMLLPGLVQWEDKRKEARVSPAVPDFFCATFKWSRGSEERRAYRLRILNYSGHGLALILEKKDHLLFETLKPGERLSEITLFSEAALTMVDGVLRHKTMIENGIYQGYGVIGLETDASLFLNTIRFDFLTT